jgi:hypothetical protein
MGTRQCNYCHYENLKTVGKVETKPHPFENFPDGVDVYVDGVWRIWFGELPNKCNC